MGLLLSVLVFCVGVVELITFFSTVRRNVVQRPAATTDLDQVKLGYMKDLHGVRDRIFNDLQTLRKSEAILRLDSHEDIDLQFDDNVSKSSTRLLVTERTSKSRSASPRRQFVVSDESHAIQEANALPEFFIEQQTTKDDEGIQRYVLKNESATIPIPLPRQFLVSENGSRSRSSSPTAFRRSPSPYPTAYDLSAPRNSICPELLDNPNVNVREVDEDNLSKSPTPDKELLVSSTFNSTEFWPNRSLKVPNSSRSKSRSASPITPDEERLYNVDYLNSLDGCKKKSKKNVNKHSKAAAALDVSSSTSKVTFESSSPTTQVLSEAAKELRRISLDDGETQKKQPEAFWVGK